MSGENGDGDKKWKEVFGDDQILCCGECGSPWLEARNVFGLVKKGNNIVPGHMAIVNICPFCNKPVGDPMYLGKVQKSGSSILTPNQRGRVKL